MNENAKTGLFVVAAVVIAAGAWLMVPRPPKHAAEEVAGQLLFPDFTDPLAVTRMEIMRFDPAGRKCLPFEVAQVKNRWAIPSHGDYPADAKEHLAEAATSVMGLKAIGAAPKLGSDAEDLDQDNVRKLHNEYGVIDPNPETVKSSDDGVGMRVTMKDKEGKSLLALIIGKQASEQGNQHYVRIPDKDPVYIVDVDTTKLSTKFEDWIERNLLKMNTMDLKRVDIKDYSVDLADQRDPIKSKGELLLEYAGSGDQAWKLAKDMVFDRDRLVPKKMAADEELDTKKLDDLKYALDDLKIVDVERKPGGVSADLRFARTLKDQLVLRSLEGRGFYPAEDPSRGKEYFQLVSNKGEINLLMNDGVQYVLRFGEVASESEHADKTKDKSKAKDEKKDEAGPGMNRYLLVMAEFNPDAIAKPVKEPLPEEKPAAKTASDKAAKPGDKKEEKKPDIKAERERVAKENKRKQDEYEEKVAAGRKHVKELNERFADWYYVISDDVYRKIHLGRDQVVKKKEKKDEKKDEAGHAHDHEHADAPAAKSQPAPKAEPVSKIEPAPKAEPTPKAEPAKKAEPAAKPAPAAKAAAEKAKPAAPAKK
jgi:hypothetical protein